jgi:hypothetical protein
MVDSTQVTTPSHAQPTEPWWLCSVRGRLLVREASGRHSCYHLWLLSFSSVRSCRAVCIAHLIQTGAEAVRNF